MLTLYVVPNLALRPAPLARAIARSSLLTARRVSVVGGNGVAIECPPGVSDCTALNVAALAAHQLGGTIEHAMTCLVRCHPLGISINLDHPIIPRKES